MITRISYVILVCIAFAGAPAGAAARPSYEISPGDHRVDITAGILERRIDLAGDRIGTISLKVDGADLLSSPSAEFRVTFHRAEPNRCPVGLDRTSTRARELQVDSSRGGDAAIKDFTRADDPDLSWINPVEIDGNSLADMFRLTDPIITQPQEKVHRLNIRAQGKPDTPLHGVSIDLFYEVCQDYPVIRKWIEIANNSPSWLKIDSLTIDAVSLAPGFRSATLLTPEERGACAAVISFGDARHSRGIIAASEIPSAARAVSVEGAMGYAEEHFEWVLGPSERFISERVFHFAYAGPVDQTLSGVSTPLDRAVERPFKSFLERRVGVRAVPGELPVPLWCSWSNFLPAVNDTNMREMADIAARAGIAGFQIDAGWARSISGESWQVGGIDPDVRKFPDFDATCRHIASKGLRPGLWVSCFRRPDDHVFTALPGSNSCPEILRGEGVGMSYAGPWRAWYANEMIGLHDRFGAAYIKQDLTAVKFGDTAVGHDSRTRRESILRGLRGLLESQDLIARTAPGLSTELTHEIYWGTPGVPCDIAALKHACTFHIPPNDYSGCGKNSERVNSEWKYDPEKLRADLIKGCLNARQRFYAHRGLPLYCLEYYAAHMVNFRGSLTAAVQDRQVCSWLMGVPSVFAGDLASLTPEHVARYRERFETVKRLQQTYDIYRHFQYSGVPEPTDTDWHWWGKLNEQGHGAVVVLRGSAGEDTRAVNIPWVLPDRRYRVTELFSGRSLGEHTGASLRAGKVKLKLPVLGQEILELAPAE